MGSVALQRGTVDLETGLLVGEVTARLTRKERALLVALVGRQGRIATKAELDLEVWSLADGRTSRVLYSTIDRLRRKIERDPSRPVHVLTVGGRGYRFVPLRLVASPTTTRRVLGTSEPLDAFVGREEVLNALRAWWMDPDAPVVLEVGGAPGIGKTRLVKAFAYSIHADVLFVQATGAPSRALAELLSVPPSMSRLDARLQRILQRDGALVVLDDADDVAREWAVGFARPGVRVLLTTRGQDGLVLGPMELDEGRALLLARVRQRWPHWKPSIEEGASIDAVVERIRGSPLGLELAARTLLVLTPEELARRLADSPDIGLQVGLRWTWSTLHPIDRRVLACLASLKAPLEATDLEPVFGRNGLDSVGRLVDSGLVTVGSLEGCRHFSVLAPIATFALAHQSVPSSFWEAMARHFGGLGESRLLEDRLITGQGYASIRRNAAHLSDLWFRHGCVPAAAALVAWQMFDGRDESALVVFAHATPVALERRVEWQRHHAEALRRTGEVDAARELLLELLTVVRDALPSHLGRVLHSLGVLEEHHHGHDRALVYFESALVEHERHGDVFRQALSLGQRATLAIRIGEFERAATLFPACLVLVRSVDALPSEAIYLGNFGVAYLKMGRLDEAESCFRAALELSLQLRTPQFAFGNRSNLGLVQSMRGDLDGARGTFVALLAAARDTGDAMEEAVTLLQLAAVHLELGDRVASARCLDRAQPMVHRLDVELVEHQLLRVRWLRRSGDLAAARQLLAEVPASKLVAESRTWWALERAHLDGGPLPEVGELSPPACWSVR